MNPIQSKHILFILGLVFLLISLIGMLYLFSPSVTVLPETEPPTVTTMRTQVPPVTKSDGYDSVFFMNAKNRGNCKALKGKVLLNFFLVSDGNCLWTEDAIAKFQKTTDDAVYFLNYDANRFGIELEIICNYTPLSWDEQIPRENVRNVIPEMLKRLGLEDKTQASSILCSQFAADSAAPIFCFNRDERSFSFPAKQENEFEFAVLYGNTEDFRHEVLHLYGAKDLYTPERIDKIASRFFSDSVMRINGGFVLDPLNAFLIGWTETMHDSAKDFLEAVDRP